LPFWWPAFHLNLSKSPARVAIRKKGPPSIQETLSDLRT
jgi:hypothetical protein